MIQVHRLQQGFTLIELTLSMAFISMLLLGIALLTLQIGSVYNKGVTVRSVNETGQLISADIERTLNTASVVTTDFKTNAAQPETGGRLCVGATVYAWNYGTYLTSNGFNQFETSSNPMRLVKFVSKQGTNYYCVLKADGITYPAIPDDAVELMTGGGTDLAVQSFNFQSNEVAGDSRQRMYTISLTVGTNDATQIDANGCKSPGETSKADDEYCSINTFNFTARAGYE